MGRETDGNRVENSVVAGDSLQIGAVHGTVNVFTGARRLSGVPEGFWTAEDSVAPADLGLVRVRDADPLQLGVHRPIRGAGTEPSALPPYVPRDTDVLDRDGLRPLVEEASRRGGFVLLVGDSSVGKTRSLYEAVNALLPDWWLVHPFDTAQIEHLAGLSPRRLVVWLDELQNHVSGAHRLTAATVRTLLAPPRQVVVVGTLWPHYHDAWTALPAAGRDEDRHRGERELLKLAEIVHVAASFGPSERERAATLAAADERLRRALESRDFGLTQVIAGAPQLVHRWENAGPYARALMTAAVDATLLGVQSPVPEGLLRSAVPGYCGPTERAGAPDDWFEQALHYATQPLLGATSVLVPVSAGRAMGRPDGYRVADYLLQHTGRAQRTVPPPETFWEACADHLTDTADLVRTGSAAAARQRVGAAVPLLRKAVEAGSVSAMRELGALYRRMGDTAGAEEMADRLSASAHPDAALYRTVLAGWDFEELLDLAEAGNEYAVSRLIEYGHPRLAISLLLEDLDPDDLWAWYRLAELFHEEDENERAIPILEMLHEREYDDAILLLAELLREEGNVERLYELTQEGYFAAVCCLAGLLQEEGRTEEALGVLWEFADEGNGDVDYMLAHTLALHGDLDTLLERAAQGHADAASEAATLLQDRGDLDRAVEVLTPIADAGGHAAGELAELLRLGGRVGELRKRAAAGDAHAAGELARLAIEEGDLDEAVRLHALKGAASAAFRLTDQLVDALVARGEADRAVQLFRSSGDSPPFALRGLLKKLGRAEELRALVDQGDPHAVWDLVHVLRDQGRADEADALLSRGLTADGRVPPTGPAG
jgi:tetratricopeptide (TPR) repeat protein